MLILRLRLLRPRGTSFQTFELHQSCSNIRPTKNVRIYSNIRTFVSSLINTCSVLTLTKMHSPDLSNSIATFCFLIIVFIIGVWIVVCYFLSRRTSDEKERKLQLKFNNGLVCQLWEVLFCWDFLDFCLIAICFHLSVCGPNTFFLCL